MGGFVEYLNDIVESKLDELAEQIENEMKTAVNTGMKRSGKRSGNAVNAIHIESDSATSRFIGANIDWKDHTNGGLHLYYFDQGNTPRHSPDGLIHPTRSKALHLKNIGDDVWAKSVHPYGGKGVISDIAKKHR